MKVLLVSPNTESLHMPVYPVGMHLVADAIQAEGHETAVVDMFEHDDPWAAVQRTVQDVQPDLIGISVRNIDDQSMQDTKFLLEGTREVIRSIREIASVPLVIGGAGYSIFPDSALQYLEADMGLSGEGEITLPALVQAMQNTISYDAVPGLHLPGKGAIGPGAVVRDLDACPLPQPDRLGAHRTNGNNFWMPYQTRRGCPLECSYCSTGSIEGRHIRKRSVSQVVANLKEFEDAGVRKVFFVDNTFNMPGQYARDLCRAMIDAGLHLTWCAIVYPKAMPQDLANLMAAAGCTQVSLGFESGSPATLSALNKRFTTDEVRQISSRLAQAGIQRMGFLLLGGPGETRETVQESLEFAESLHLDALKITVGIRIYPHTRLAHEAVRAGLVTPEDTLLEPRFYLQPHLSEWLPEYIAEWSAEHPELVAG